MMEREIDAEYFETSAKDTDCLEGIFLKVCNELLQDEDFMEKLGGLKRFKSYREISLDSKPTTKFSTCC